MQEFDIVIRNGMIVDGARNPRWKGDIGIRDGVITRMGKIANPRARRVIDADGLVVAPGFIDLHTHYDAQVFWDPYLSTSGFHGVTSVVLGNCGFGFAPMAPELRDRAMKSMTKVEAIPLVTLETALPWDWTSYPEYLDSMDRAPKSLNVLPYVGLNPLMIAAMGFEDAKSGRMPTEAEHAEMARLLHEAMDAGACGFSAQCLGTPGQPQAGTVGGAARASSRCRWGSRRRPSGKRWRRRAGRPSCGRPWCPPATRWAPGSAATCSTGSRAATSAVSGSTGRASRRTRR